MRRSTRAEAQDDSRKRLWPDLGYWFGLSYSELRRMPKGVRRTYERAIPRIRADELARAINAATFPHMKEQDQRSLMRRLERETGADRDTKPLPLLDPTMAEKVGIGVNIVGQPEGGED